MDAKQITDRYTLADLEKWSEVTRDIDPPIRLGVFGDPVAHSLSPQMQNAALRALEINMQYARFHIRSTELRSALRFIRELDFVGINLTVPHKIAGLTQIDVADDSASRCDAVNTVRLDENKLIGSNTDAEGFSRAVRSEFSIDLRDLRVMILGAGGGTGHAIAWQCALENCERLVLVNRTPAKTNALVDRLRCWHVLETQVGGDRFRGHGGVEERQRRQCVQFRCERQVLGRVDVVQRLLAEDVARQQQFA